MIFATCDNLHLDEDREFQSLNGLCIVAVDDNADSLELVSIILEGYGARVLVAQSASEAFDAIAQTYPDILISDIAMPEVDGYELIRQIRIQESQQGGFLPAIALTAYARDEERLLALDAGFQTHVSKPIEPIELVAVVAQFARSFHHS